MRGGPARSGPIYDRLGPDGVAHIITMLSASELTLMAALVFGTPRVARADALATTTLVTLVQAAERSDAERLWDALSRERSAELRRALAGPDHEPVRSAADRGHRRVRTDTGVGVVLRLRRLFRL